MRRGHTAGPRLRLRRRPGVTLTELLVAMVLTALVVVGSWRFFASASNSMQIFNGLAIADERLALAVDLLTADARRAGFFGSPHTANDPLVCPKPATVLRAVVVEDAGSLTTYDWGENDFIAPDACIFQAPVTSTIFRPLSISGATVALDPTTEGMPGVQADFETMFDDRWLRITSPSGFSQFVTITDVSFEDHELTVSPAPMFLIDDGAGICGIQGTGGTDHELTVLTHIRYQIIEQPGENPDGVTLLVREELDPTLTTVLPATRLVVAENVVDLQCWGDQDSGDATGSDFEADTELGDDDGSADADGASDETQRMRVLHFMVSTRTDREFPSHRLIEKGGDFDLLTTFDVDGDTDTAAITVTAGGQVELSNLVVRRLQ